MKKNYDKTIIVFGGTIAAYHFITVAKKNGFKVVVFSDHIKLNEIIINNKSFRNFLIDENIKFIETLKINKKILTPYVKKNTLGISIVTFWIFKQDIIDLFNGNLYNYHGAILPKEKGGGTFTWKILSQSYEGGLTIHKITESIDEGPIVIEKKFTYPKNLIRPIDFANYRNVLEKKILYKFVSNIKNKRPLKEKNQKKKNSYYWPLLNTSLNGIINWNWNNEQIKIFINAFDKPYKGASTLYKNKLVFIKNVIYSKSNLTFHPFQSGIIIRKEEDGIFFSTSTGIIKVGIINDKKGNNIIQKLKIGERFYSTSQMIDKSLSIKAIYI